MIMAQLRRTEGDPKQDRGRAAASHGPSSNDRSAQPAPPPRLSLLAHDPPVFTLSSLIAPAGDLSTGAAPSPPVQRMLTAQTASMSSRASATSSGSASNAQLTWDDLLWVVENEVAFRFHSDGPELAKQARTLWMTGHAHALFHMADILKTVKLSQPAGSLAQVQKTDRPKVIQEFEKRLKDMATSSFAHVPKNHSTEAAFLLAQLKPNARQLAVGKLTGLPPYRLVDGMGGSPFGAFISDGGVDLLPDRYKVHGVNALHYDEASKDNRESTLVQQVIKSIQARGPAAPSASIAINKKAGHPSAAQSADFGIPGLRLLSDEEVNDRETQEAAHRAKQVSRIQQGAADIAWLQSLLAKLKAGGSPTPDEMRLWEKLNRERQ